MKVLASSICTGIVLAGVTRSFYHDLSTSSTPFTCLVCTQKLHKATTECLYDTVNELKEQVAAELLSSAMARVSTDCSCIDITNSLKSEVQQLQ